MGARGETAAAGMTIGLYNGYDPKQWHDIMRVTLARAAPVAAAFGCELATFGFPFEQARARGATKTQALRTPAEVADWVVASTTIGDGGEHGREHLPGLAAARRLHLHPFPGPAGFPPRHGRLVATTPTPDPAKAATPLQVAQALADGAPQMVLFGLGPRGLPASVLAAAPVHLELTGRGISLETATALGAIPAQLDAHLQHLERRAVAR